MCDKKITFDGVYESWPVFRIEITGILIKYGLIELISHALSGGSDVAPPHMYFQSSCLGAVLKMAVNNSLMRWPMYEG